MLLLTISWLVVIVPIAFLLYSALHTRKYIRGVADYLAAGRVAGRYVISVGDLESALGVVTIIALVEKEYQCGFAVSFWGRLALPLSLLLSLTGYCIYRFRETKSLSMGQFLEMRYNRTFRIFAAMLRTFAEMLSNMIGPAVAARFFIYFLGIQPQIEVFGLTIPTFMLLVGGVLLLCLVIIWPGGRLSLIVTDCIQGLMCYPLFVVVTVFILTEFSWSAELAPVMENRVAGESFINPYDIDKLRDFNLFALIVSWVAMVLQRASWIGNDSSSSGRTPHEQKMASVLGAWRNGFSSIMTLLIAVALLTLMWHPDFAAHARNIRLDLTRQVAAEVIDDSEVRAELSRRFAALPEQKRVYQVDPPLSSRDNPDTVYLQTAYEVIAPTPGGPGRFQEFRTLYNQMLLPVGLREIFPVLLMGLFTLLMLMLMLSTDDSRVFNASATIVQDIIMPLRKTPLSPGQHIRYLRGCTILVAGFFFCGSLFMAQMDYLQMFISVTCSIWLGGAGPVMVGGLYTRFGTTAGAFAALLTGAGVSVGGIVMQRTWPNYIYPWLRNAGWLGDVNDFLIAVSGPFQPWIDWRIDPVKFPINSYELYFLSMLSGVVAYVAVSLLTCRRPYNLERMLHRGIYDTEGKKNIHSPWSWKNVYGKIIGITPEYTTTDKVIAWSVAAWSLGYTLGIMFFGVIIWNAFDPWPQAWWGVYFYINSIVTALLIGAVSTVWFLPCGIRDLRRLYKDLAARIDNPLDDGRVENQVSLADAAAFARRREEPPREQEK